MNKLLLLLLTLTFSTMVMSQSQIKLWHFEDGEMDGWTLGNDGEAVVLSEDYALSGTQSIALIASNTAANVDLINDQFKNLKTGDIVTFHVYVPASAIADINGLQVFWQDGDSWDWNSNWFNGSDMVPDEWNVLSYEIPEVLDPLQRLGLQLTGFTAEATPVIYVDDIIVSRVFGPGDILGAWSFEDMSLGDWAKGNDGDTILITEEISSDGSFAVKIQSAANHANIEFQNDVFDLAETGDTIRFDIYTTSADQANINGLQIFWQDDGDSWAWNSEWKNGSDLTADGWQTITYVYPEILPPLNRIGFQLVGISADVTPAVYIDNIKVIRGGEVDEEEVIVRELVGFWSFEDLNLGDWMKGNDGDTIYISDEQASDGAFSAKLVSASNGTNIEFQNDVFDNVETGDTIMMDVFVSSENLAIINGLQIFWQDDGDSWAWNADWVGGSTLTPDTWNTLVFRYPDVIHPLNRIGLQMVSLSAGDTPHIFVDNIRILGTPVPPMTEAAAITLESEEADLGADFGLGSEDGIDYVYPLTNFLEGASTFPGTEDKLKTYTVNFNAPGMYNLYAKVYVGPDAAEDDSFFAPSGFGIKDANNAADWVVVNSLHNIGFENPEDTVTSGGNTSFQIYKWVNVSELVGVQYEVTSDTLPYMFQIGAREDGLRFDKIAFGNAYYGYTVTQLENAEEGFEIEIDDPGAALRFESEHSELGLDFATGTESDETGEVTFVYALTNFNEDATSFPGSADRVKTYDLKFNYPGTYNLYARVKIGPGGVDDASFFTANGFGNEKDVNSESDWIVTDNLHDIGFANVTDTVEGNGDAGIEVYKWINVSGLLGITFEVGAENLEQKFQIASRDDGLNFDKIAFGNVAYTYTVDELNKGRIGSLSSSVVALPEMEVQSFEKIMPTPFEYETTFIFNLDVSSEVRIEIFNTMGARVAVLNQGKLNQGEHAVSWRPGSDVVGGVYYIVLNSGIQKMVGKTIYIK